ncbi:hypothetical protein ABZ235_28155 [Streptomyces canus]|uniref:hypothetical protein n=1 Tax=Streptomyces canus TaxID=58343 RepID=UPI0033BB202E
MIFARKAIEDGVEDVPANLRADHLVRRALGCFPLTRTKALELAMKERERYHGALTAGIPLDRIRAIVGRGRASRVNSVANLTFGVYGHLLKVPENWAALGWAIDQEYFLTTLEECRNFRNSLMHFSPDPITDEQLLPAQGLLALLRSVDPQT